MVDSIEMMMMAFLPLAISCDFSVSTLEASVLATSVFVGMVIGLLGGGRKRGKERGKEREEGRGRGKGKGERKISSRFIFLVR